MTILAFPSAAFRLAVLAFALAFIFFALPVLAADGAPALSLAGLLATFWQWCLANPMAVVGLVVYVLLNTINRLSAYPRAGGIVSVLKIICDLVSVLPHRDSPSYFTLPLLQRSKPPEDSSNLVELRPK